MYKWIGLLLVLIFQVTAAVFAAVTPPAFSEKTVPINHHPIYYYDVGQGEPIILIHGLFANKEQWRRMIPILDTEHRVIALDLPGYGKSLGFPFKDYDLNNQVILLHHFLTKLHVHHFHIAGNSMGGAISALYTVKYPNEILSLTFIGSPLGVTTPKLSETNRLFNQGINPFLPTSKKDVKLLMHLLFVHPPTLSEEKINFIIQDNIKNYSQKNKITQMMNSYRNLLDKKLSIHSPILILWGNEDRIFNVSGAKKLKQHFPQSDLIIIKGTGHLPQLECPKTSATDYLDFLHDIHRKEPKIFTAACF